MHSDSSIKPNKPETRQTSSDTGVARRPLAPIFSNLRAFYDFASLIEACTSSRVNCSSSSSTSESVRKKGLVFSPRVDSDPRHRFLRLAKNAPLYYQQKPLPCSWRSRAGHGTWTMEGLLYGLLATYGRPGVPWATMPRYWRQCVRDCGI
ncbi:hypothetical protein J6590_070642 [Homalodisca vitripennis]|nr:hypothetical protein J6590_070642 [Homalodisca vitripennis]